MNRLMLLTGFLVVSALTGFGDPTPDGIITVGGKTMTRSELHEKMAQARMRKNGGIVREANSAKGVFVVLNAQKRVPLSAIRTIDQMIDQWLRVQTSFKDISGEVSCSNAKQLIGENGGTVGVLLTESDGFPALLPAPEDGWVIINVKRLMTDNPDDAKLASRVRKEILRGLCFVTGGIYLTRADPLMRDVKGLQDLDKLPSEQYGLEIITHVLQSSSFYGLKPWNQATYQKACEQGWASQPTNQWQKAIWDKVHAPPSKPLKITYDKDKQKPVVK